MGEPTVAAIIATLQDAQLTFANEGELQASIHAELAAAGIESEREVRLSGRAGRIDLLAGQIGIEVKVAGSWVDATRQLTRYAHCDEISALVLVTTRARHGAVPRILCGKPVALVSLIGAGL